MEPFELRAASGMAGKNAGLAARAVRKSAGHGGRRVRKASTRGDSITLSDVQKHRFCRMY
jgi:hypothetical protein